jgi:hypothetical protein
MKTSKPLILTMAIGLLSACELVPVKNATEFSQSSVMNNKEVTALPLPQAAEEAVLGGHQVHCLEERFIVPPRGKDKKAPKFKFAEKYKDLVDPQSLGVALNERDINFSFESDSGSIQFTNPGKSRAVIDVSYCIYFPIDDSSKEEEEDDDDGDDSGVIPSDDILYYGTILVD